MMLPKFDIEQPGPFSTISARVLFFGYVNTDRFAARRNVDAGIHLESPQVIYRFTLLPEYLGTCQMLDCVNYVSDFSCKLPLKYHILT